MKRKRISNSATRAASFDRLDRPVQAWLRDDFGMLEHGDAILYMMNGFERDFRRWWRVHRPGQEFVHPYQWWTQRKKEHSASE